MGPLAGFKVLEIAGIGPGPFCAMLLADMGAEVIRIDRTTDTPRSNPARVATDISRRGRKSIAVDLKTPEGVETVLKLVEKADALQEGFRPGVMERLGLGPDVCLARNPGLVYGRMTGWGQDGPMSQAAGHDINYIALSGALHAIGRRGEKPVPPLNLVGDFGGGGMFLAFGIVAALLERSRSGKGQVVDAAMTEGSSILMAMFWGMRHAGGFSPLRGTNTLDSGSHFYDTYETKDGKWVSFGSIEPQFYAEFLRLTGLDIPNQHDSAAWPELKEKVAACILTKTRDEWSALMEGTDVCFAPVLDIEEAARHPHNVARKAFVEANGLLQPAPAPRFSRTEPEIMGPSPAPGQHTREILTSWGIPGVDALIASGAVVQTPA
ncbi:MAG TPA: CaiB/BaiF CoA-transferase family protein [Tepidiformaceae bacterium]|nr:CaiB/BaiF CoA-transferase family protein [Tepidiformaceae bacterium]